MAGEWTDVTLGDVARFDSGRRNSQDAVSGGKYPFFTCSQEILRHSEFDFDTEAVIMAGNNAEARFHLQYFKGQFAARQRTYIITPSTPDLDCRFLYYAMHGLQSLFSAQAQGTTTKFVTIGILRNAAISLPPLGQQQAIAHSLGTLDDKMELNRRMNETLEAMARALFKSWFVDFDPVRAKAEGRNPGLPKHLTDLFPDSLEDSELGEIPRGWKVGTLSNFCSTQYGYTASAIDEPIGPKLLRVTDINKRNWIEWADVPHCAIEPKTRQSYALGVGDLVVARMADPGKAAIIEDEVDAVFASYLVRLKTTSLANSYYVYGFLKSDLYAEYAAGSRSGSVQANMNAKVIVGASLVIPPAPVVEQFLSAILPLRRRLAASVRESHTLAGLRNALLPKLISGEVRAGVRSKGMML